MPFQAHVGASYSRKDVTALLGLQPTNTGNWSRGYPRFNDEFFVFATIGNRGRVGPDYDTYWEDDLLSWTTTNSGHLGQPSVADLVGNQSRVHLFYRYSDRSDFVYAGLVAAHRFEGDHPLRVWWRFNVRPRNVQLRGILAAKGFKLAPPSRYAQEASKDNLAIYVKVQTEDFPLVLSPSFEGDLAALTSSPDVLRPSNEFFYHNSGMKLFPRRRNDGKTPIAFGLAFGFRTTEVIGTFIDQALELDTSWLGTGASAAKQKQADLRTETEARRAARLGQSQFRADLLMRYRWKCALTPVDMPEVLRASHIKPWHKATGKERLDADNGILLSIHLDLLFDKGLISFRDDGTILISPRQKPSVQEAYGIGEKLPPVHVWPGNLPYLEHHRSVEFKRE